MLRLPQGSASELHLSALSLRRLESLSHALSLSNEDESDDVWERGALGCQMKVWCITCTGQTHG